MGMQPLFWAYPKWKATALGLAMTESRLSVDDARAKATECRELAREAQMPAHRIMLEHMADTWQRIADNMQADSGTF